MRTRRSRTASTLALAFSLSAVLGAVSLPTPLVGVVQANTNCPGSTPSFGSRFSAGPCIVDTDTAWGNGSFILRGDLIIETGARLTLHNMDLRLDPGVEQEFRIYLVGGQLVVRGGTITSNNTNHWMLETTSDPSVLVDFDGVNVSRAGANGGGPYSAFFIAGGQGHRFRNLTVSDSALRADWNYAVFTIWNRDIRDLRIENSTFRATGKVLHVVAAAGPPSGIVFRDNVITGYRGPGGDAALYGSDLDILNNSIDTGGNPAIWIAGGGGPGWPRADFYHRIAYNSITSATALRIADGAGYDVSWNAFHGKVIVGGNGTYFGNNNISDLDEQSPVVTFYQNGTVRHNTWWNVTLHEQAALVDNRGYGNVTFFANTMYLKCAGTNCLGIEVINVQDQQRAIHPGFPALEVSWNNITWVRLDSGTNSASLDNEFSRRLYIHNNTQRVIRGGVAPGEAVTSPIEAGGMQDSLVENNTIWGPATFGIFNYIYDRARNVFQYNFLNDTEYAGIFQTGNTTIRHNRIENASNGWWICPNGPCAGGGANPANLVFYDNTVAFRPGGTDITIMNPPDFNNNTLIAHGLRWRDGFGGSHPVPGGWLYFANDTIERLTWANVSGARRVSMTVQGDSYFDYDRSYGAEGDAALTIEGPIDRRGSVDAATVLWSLNPNGTTRLTATGTGPTRMVVAAFRPSTRYDISIWNSGTSTWRNTSFSTDAGGMGEAALDLSSMANITISPGSRTPPFAVFDVSPLVGNLTTDFRTDASSSWDLEDPADALAVRWDWEDDGTWDTGWATQKVAQHRYSASGVLAIRMAVRDTGGNTAETARLVGVDGEPPLTTSSLSGTSGANGWFVSPVTVSLRAVDGLSGVAATYHRIDGGPWEIFVGPFAVTDDGAHLVEYFSVDEQGNRESPARTDLRVDTKAPSTAHRVEASAGIRGWYVSAASVSLAAVDPASGIAVVRYRVDEGTWQLYDYPVQLGEGRHVVEYGSEDFAGNDEAIHRVPVDVDATPPSLSNLSPAGVQSRSVVIVTWSGYDATSGLAFYEVRVDGGRPHRLLEPEPQSLALRDGEHIVFITGTDLAGNSASAEIRFRVDTNPFSPTGPLAGIPTYLVAAAIVCAAVFAIRRRRKGDPQTTTGGLTPTDAAQPPDQGPRGGESDSLRNAEGGRGANR